MGSIFPPGTELWLDWDIIQFPSSGGRCSLTKDSSKPILKVLVPSCLLAHLHGCQDPPSPTGGSLEQGQNSEEGLPCLPNAWS